MSVHVRTAPGPAQELTDPPCAGGDARKAEIARAVWTEIHWLMPRDRAVVVTVEGDAISVELGPVDPHPSLSP